MMNSTQASSFQASKSAFIPAVLQSSADGVVRESNAQARAMMPNALNRPCWQVVPGIAGSSAAACSARCVQETLAGATPCARQSRFWMGKSYATLTCVRTESGITTTIASIASDTAPLDSHPTGREREVLQHLSTGATTDTIAKSLGITESTVKTHVENMRTKLNVPTRAGLVALAFRRGWIQ